VDKISPGYKIPKGKKNPGTHQIRGWVGLKDGLNILKEIPLPLLGFEPWTI